MFFFFGLGEKGDGEAALFLGVDVVESISDVAPSYSAVWFFILITIFNAVKLLVTGLALGMTVGLAWPWQSVILVPDGVLFSTRHSGFTFRFKMLYCCIYLYDT